MGFRLTRGTLLLLVVAAMGACGGVAMTDTLDGGDHTDATAKDSSVTDVASVDASVDAALDADAKALADGEAGLDAGAIEDAEAGPDADAGAITFGNPTIKTLGDSNSEPFYSDYLLGQAVVTTAPITLTKLAVNALSAGQQVRLGLYSDSSGNPGTLLASTAATTMAVGANEIAVTASTTLPAGTYWIMAVYNQNATIATGNDKSTATKYISLAFTSALPATFPTPTTYVGDAIGLYLVGTP